MLVVTPESVLVLKAILTTLTPVETLHIENTGQTMETSSSKPWDTSSFSEVRQQENVIITMIFGACRNYY